VQSRIVQAIWVGVAAALWGPQTRHKCRIEGELQMTVAGIEKVTNKRKRSALTIAV